MILALQENICSYKEMGKGRVKTAINVSYAERPGNYLNTSTRKESRTFASVFSDDRETGDMWDLHQNLNTASRDITIL
jgi:hypothetical protein